MEEVIIIPLITAVQAVPVPIFDPSLVIISSLCSSLATYGLMKLKNKKHIFKESKEKQD